MMQIEKRYWLMPFLFVACATASAEGFYAGAKYGVMDVDDSAFDEANNGGILVGYDIGRQDLFSWAVEAEFTTSLSDGDFGKFGVRGEWDIDTQALYGVVRLGQEFYGKLKIGFLNEDVSAKAGGISLDDSDSGLSAGLGAGFRASQTISIEAEYTQIEQDVSFISVGVNLLF